MMTLKAPIGFMSRLPYLLLVVCYCLIGFVFLALNGPLIFDLFIGKRYTSYPELMSGLISSWGILAQPSATSIFVSVVATVIAGFIINALAQGLSALASSLAQPLARVAGLNMKFFIGGLSFLDEDY